ncbi:hypothetical protein GLI01_18740 [Gluconacetobacter liquefaciens]|nr:hypothetical protein AA0522_1015 [Gluconacetobacter liquefaciens NRIC 0522]GEB37839.1 hypothetical protein GLI01_18740 [Gluconacetobacter liquefaciens]
MRFRAWKSRPIDALAPSARARGGNGIVATTADAPNFADMILGMAGWIGLPLTVLAETGSTRFHLQSLANVATEWTLVVLAYNCCRITRLTVA